MIAFFRTHTSHFPRFTPLFLLSLLLLQTSVFAQDGVLIDYQATPPTRDASAILELRSANQGFLAPKVAIANLATAAPVTSPAEGLVVYNTNATTGKGYYYWNGSQWLQLTSSSGSGYIENLNVNNTFGTGQSASFDVQDNGEIGGTLKVGGNMSVGATTTPHKLFVTGGSGYFVTSSNTTPFTIARIYSTSNFQELRVGLDDTNTHFHYINDESAGKIQFRIQNTDTEGTNTGANANDNTILTLQSNTAGGRAGIGTVSPTQALDVDGQIRMRTGATAGYIPVSSADGTMTWTDPTTITASDNDWAKVGGGTPALTDEIYHTGNVGIGTTNPDAKLDITSNVSFPLLIQRTGDVDEVGIEFHDDGSTGQVGYISFNHRDASSNGNAASIHLRSTEPTLGVILEGEGGYYAGSKVALRTNGNSFLTGGNVGIGTTNPTRNLVVESTGDAAIWINGDSDNSGEADNAYLKISQDGNLVEGILGFVGNTNIDPEGNTYTGMLNNGMLLGTTTAADLQLGTNDNARVTIETGGDVGIGTTNPTTKLDVDGTVRIRGGSPNPGDVLTATSTNGTATWGNPSSNVVYAQTTGTWEPNSGGDSWYNITDYTGWLSVSSGDIITIQADWLTRMESGSNNDDFYWRVFMDGTSGCSDLYHNEKGYYRPNENSDDHDNFKNATYLDYWVSNCTGQVRFRLQSRNTGDDDWEVMDRTLIVRKN